MDKINEFILYIQQMDIKQVINIILAIVAVIAGILISSLIAYIIVRIFYKKDGKKDIKKGTLYKSIRVFINISGIYVASKILDLSYEQNLFCDKIYRIVIIWTVACAICGIFEARDIIFKKIGKGENVKNNALMTSVVSKIVQIFLYIIAGYLSLKEFGFDLGGLATGLGITGAVVVLACQDLAKQIFAGITIFVDKPFEIGDWIEVGEVSGNVKDITIKSTKLKTMDDTVVTVPNDIVTGTNVINWGKISKRAFKTNLKLSLETDEAVVEKVINRIKFILKYNNDIEKESIYIHCDKIDQSGINIKIYTYTTITDYWPYQDFCNKLNLTILNILDTQGVRLAYPGQDIYIKENLPTAIEKKETKILSSGETKHSRPTKIKK